MPRLLRPQLERGIREIFQPEQEVTITKQDGAEETINLKFPQNWMTSTQITLSPIARLSLRPAMDREILDDWLNSSIKMPP
jgi:hypothetical protein